MGQSLFLRTFSLKNGRRLLLAIVVTVGAVILAKSWWDSQVFQGYDASLPLEPRFVSQADFEGYPAERIEIAGLKGEHIPFYIVRPKPAAGEKFPCVIFLYGIGQNARFFDAVAPIFAKAGFVMAMPEQYQCGERRKRGIGLLREALALRERSSRIVPETRRLVDFLSQDAGIDPERIFLIGASYGGITGCSVVAHEPRIARAALVMAGGNLPRLLDTLARSRLPDSPSLASAGASLAAWLLRPFEPLDFIGEIAPRPVLFLNLDNDEMIDTACAQALYQGAGEPREEMTYSDAHNAISEKTVRRMLQDALGWMKGSQNP